MREEFYRPFPPHELLPPPLTDNECPLCGRCESEKGPKTGGGRKVTPCRVKKNQGQIESFVTKSLYTGSSSLKLLSSRPDRSRPKTGLLSVPTANRQRPPCHFGRELRVLEPPGAADASGVSSSCLLLQNLHFIQVSFPQTHVHA